MSDVRPQRCTARAYMYVLPFLVLLVGVSSDLVGGPENGGRIRKDKIALLSVATVDFVEQAKYGLSSKEHYCLRHGYSWILHLASTQDADDLGRAPHWLRVKALKENLKYYDWIFYTDADTFVTNEGTRLEDFIRLATHTLQSTDGHVRVPFLVVQDGMEINSGGFFIRNCPEAFQFLDEWWDMYEISQHWRYAITTYDQVPFVMTMLRYAYRSRQPYGRALCETRYWMSYAMFVGCWNGAMSQLGLVLGRRSHSFQEHSGIVYYTHPNEGEDDGRGLRGFNMVYTIHDAALSETIHPIQIWQPGDFIAHVTHSPTHDVAVRARLLTRHARERDYRRTCTSAHNDDGDVADLTRILIEGCDVRPCLSDLWLHYHDEDNFEEDTPSRCVADYGTSLGDVVCCGQPGTIDIVGVACPSSGRPFCSGYVANATWGRCVASSQMWSRWHGSRNYTFKTRWHSYVPPRPREELIRYAQQDQSCVGDTNTTFFETYLSLSYAQDLVGTNLFRVHTTEDQRSRFYEFLDESSAYVLFKATFKDVIRSFVVVCMDIDAALSRDGRFHPPVYGA